MAAIHKIVAIYIFEYVRRELWQTSNFGKQNQNHPYYVLCDLGFTDVDIFISSVQPWIWPGVKTAWNVVRDTYVPFQFDSHNYWDDYISKSSPEPPTAAILGYSHISCSVTDSDRISL